jgi:hypothetical protein
MTALGISSIISGVVLLYVGFVLKDALFDAFAPLVGWPIAFLIFKAPGLIALAVLLLGVGGAILYGSKGD